MIPTSTELQDLWAKNDTLRLLARAQELCFKRTQSRAALALVLSLLLAGSVSVTSSLAGRAKLASSEIPAATAPIQLYSVKIQRRKRKAASGLIRDYTLYIPEPKDGGNQGPYPLVVLIHGFLMTGAQQSANAMNLAERGFVVLTPNVTKVLLGDDTRMKNVHDVLDHISWLTGKDSPLPGKVDPNRVAVGGNSSGGAVILEVAVEAQRTNVPLAALVDLDGVIWDRSFDRVPTIKPVKILSLRCEPSICNEHARQLRVLQQLKFPIDDVKVIGAHHCDVENPTTLRCSCVCGTSRDKYRRIFAQLLYTWLRDTFNTEKFSKDAPSFNQLAQELQDNHKAIARLNQPVGTWLSSSSENKTR